MAAHTSLQNVADSVCAALKDLVKDPGARVEVFESQPGNLRAIVVSDFFSDMGITERQERIWAYLKKSLEEEQLVRLYGVHPYDSHEYGSVAPASSSAGPQILSSTAPSAGDESENRP